jgi:predicted transglutaminase-like cysteine proteinase
MGINPKEERDMKIALASIAAAALFAAAAPAAAEKPEGASPSAAGSSASQAAPAKGERKFCRRIENSARRTDATTLCLTQAGWKKFQEAQED